MAADVDAAVMARRTPGFSGAELSNLVNEAALLAAKSGAANLTSKLLDQARDKVIMGVERCANYGPTSHSRVATARLSDQAPCSVQAGVQPTRTEEEEMALNLQHIPSACITSLCQIAATKDTTECSGLASECSLT